MLEKKRLLKRIEFTFVDDKIHESCHCVYDDCVMEDGVRIAGTNHREAMTSNDVMATLAGYEKYVPQESV